MTMNVENTVSVDQPVSSSPKKENFTILQMKKLFSGFSKLSRGRRYQRLLKSKALGKKDVNFLKNGGLKKLDLADKLIENVVGYFQVPLGVATNFVIDDQPLWIPMAVEETSIIAAASKTARWVNENGIIQTSCPSRISIGQIQIHNVKNFNHLQEVVQNNESQWIQDVHEQVVSSMVKRGGGVRGFQVRKINSENKEMAVIHVFVDTCDAMGANIINQICEYLKKPIEESTGEDVSLCILSNLSDQCLASAHIVMKGIDEHSMKKIVEASVFAEEDPYRAATSNKGVMNGISAVVMATGNDYRAIEAGLHAYASRSGHYRSITEWRIQNGELHGRIKAPMMLGVVGGMTRLHPTAQICMRMMGVQSAKHLARICVAVGLVQNLGAIRALTTVGIIEGHMKLHIKNLTQDAGAKGWEFPIIQKHLEILLKLKKTISLSHAIEAVKLIRDRIRQVENFKTLNKQQWAKNILKELRDKYYYNQ